MKKTFFLSLLLGLGMIALAQSQVKPQWTGITSDSPGTFKTQLISSSENSIKVNVQVPGFYATAVTTPRGEANVITVPKSISTAQAGEPDMPMTGIPLMIGDKARMNVRVIEAQYQDFEGIEVAPSKGDFPRTIDPATVPYTYGECYEKDAFFPAKNLGMYEPYIIRDFRGQNMTVYPFAYNPATKTLRVYYNMTVEMYKVDNKGENVIESRRSNEVKMDPDFKSVYQRHFLNFEEGTAKYTVLDEEGDLLIICYDNFISSMTNFVNWKKTRGVNTTIVKTSTIASSLTYSTLQNYIKNQYNANNNLTHVLLVGDAAQIPGYTFTGGGSSWSGKGDNPYGQVVGTDIYNDVIIGRFSAGSAEQVTTQVNRILTYERDLTTSATWCQKGLGISASAGSGGHYSEDDYEHVENLRSDLMTYGYSTVYQDYASVSGYPSSSTSTISSHINSGVGIINYCNHGEETGWQSHYYMNSHVNALTNNNKLPFIFSVACLVGKYDYTGGDCFAETWMHATNSSTPTGAVSGMFSYISQPWIPPMWAQDEFVDILCELKGNNIKRSFGGAAMNSLFSIFDNYSTSTQQAVGCYQAWVLYGDPTLMMRTKTPQAMTVTHDGVLPLGSTTYSIQVSNGNGSLATITDANHNILGKATVSNGTATINISATLSPEAQLTLCVFGYNKVTYLGTINVVGGTQYTIHANASPTEGGTVSGAGTYYESISCTLTATANTGYEFTNWTKDGVQVSTNPSYTFTVTSDASYTANFRALTAHSVVCNATENGSISAAPTTAYKGETITLTAEPDPGFFLGTWTVTDDNDQNITVTNNQFTMPDSNVTVSATFVVGYNITLASVMNGNISVSTNYCSAGTSVALTATATIGFVLDSWIVYKTGDVNTVVSTNGNSFIMPEYDVTVSAVFCKPEGGDVTVGSGTSTTTGDYLPTSDYYKYSLTQQIYTKDEVGEAGTITAISFYYNTATNSKSRSLEVYMKHTTNSTISSWVTVSSSDQVYSGSHTFTKGWNTITLTTPFVYNGTNNLLLTVDDNTGDWSTNTYFYTYATNAQRAVYYRNDSNNLSPTTTNTITPSTSTNNAQIKFTKMTPENDPYISVSSSVLSGFTYAEEEGPSGAQAIAVIGRNMKSNMTVTAPADYEVSLDDNGTFTNAITLSATNGNIQTMIYVRLKADLVEGIYNNEALALCSGITTQNVTLNGEVSEIAGNYYFITATANPTEGGSVTGGGRYREGTMITLTATPADGYLFMGWEEDGSLSSSSLTLSFNAEVDRTLVAQFAPITHQTQSFNLGWGWVSFYVNLQGAHGLQLLEQAFGENGFMIKSLEGFAQYANGAWAGTLNSIEVEKMYQINASSSGTLSLAETAVKPEDHPINIESGWNWIGYPCAVQTDVATAFSHFNCSDNDILKSYNAMTTYIDGYGWWGSLNKMTPGKGYMYNSQASDSKTLVYALGAKGTQIHTANNDNLHWNVNSNGYRDNACIIVTIDAKDFSLSENVEVGAFVNGECRGNTRLLYVEPLDSYLAFLTVYGNEEDRIQFMAYDGNDTYTMDEQVTYKDNLVAGSAYQPIVLHQSMNPFFYPNPVKKGQQVSLELPATLDHVTVEVIDAMGRVVVRKDAMRDFSTDGMAPGMYTVRVMDEQGMVKYGKLIIK